MIADAREALRLAEKRAQDLQNAILDANRAIRDADTEMTGYLVPSLEIERVHLIESHKRALSDVRIARANVEEEERLDERTREHQRREGLRQKRHELRSRLRSATETYQATVQAQAEALARTRNEINAEVTAISKELGDNESIFEGSQGPTDQHDEHEPEPPKPTKRTGRRRDARSL
jgi:chromosome segregation ATPase